jgi:hypothetical protein
MSLSEARTFGALVGSLLLLGASFVLLVLAPQLLARFHTASETVPSGGFLPIAAASGIALGGGAAMIAVMARLVRDIEIRPYACLAPVLAVFTGYVMWGLRAQLPLESVSTEYVGLFAIAVSVAGGALVAQRGGARGIGWTLALFAPLVLLGLLWASSGESDVGAVISGLAPQVKMYLGLLIGTGLALGAIGEGARTLARRALGDRLVVPGGGSLSYGGGASSSYGASAPIEEERLFDPPAQHRTEPEPQRYQPPPMRFDIPAERPPRVNVWEFEDEELTVPKRRLPWVTLLLLLALASGAGGAFYYGVYMPKQQKEQAALQVLQAREEQLKAAGAQDAAQQRAVESKEAAERLEAAIANPGKPGTAAPAATDKAAPVEAKPVAPAAEAKKPALAAPAAKLVPAPAAKAAPAPVAKPAAAERAEPARKPGDATKVDAPGKGMDEGKGNNDPIYGL